MIKKLLHSLRTAGIIEGISFLVLLLIAMPLKYFFDQPLYVKYIGWAHGVLFITYLTLALAYALKAPKKFTWLVIAFFAALIPLGTFVFDRQLKKEESLP